MLAGAPYVLGSGAPAPVSAQSPAENTAPTTAKVSPIPIPEIAQRAEDVTALLRRRAEQLVASPEIEAIGARLPAVSEDIPRRWEMRRGVSPSPSALPRWPIPGGDSPELWQSDVLTRGATPERELEQIEAMRSGRVARGGRGFQAPATVLGGSTIRWPLAAARRSVEEQRAVVRFKIGWSRRSACATTPWPGLPRARRR
jgi:hypothetical protein